jgi:hypothetical protein
VKTFERLATSSEASSDDRTIRFTFATPNVALDGHRILPGAWESRGHDGLAEFRSNPCFLWAHQQDQPPVGKVLTISEKQGVLSGSVKFDTDSFSDLILSKYRSGSMNGASVSWLPID